MYPSANNVPRLRAIWARSVNLIETGGRYWEVQFGLPPFSIALKNSPGVGTVRASTDAAFFNSSAESGLSAAVVVLPAGCWSADAEKADTNAITLTPSHFRNTSICGQFINWTCTVQSGVLNCNCRGNKF